MYHDGGIRRVLTQLTKTPDRTAFGMGFQIAIVSATEAHDISNVLCCSGVSRLLLMSASVAQQERALLGC